MSMDILGTVKYKRKEAETGYMYIVLEEYTF